MELVPFAARLGEKFDESKLSEAKAPKMRSNKQTIFENNNSKSILTHCVLLCRNYNSELVAFAARLGEKFDDSKLREAKVSKSKIKQIY